jgi:hypothetical protein
MQDVASAQTVKHLEDFRRHLIQDTVVWKEGRRRYLCGGRVAFGHPLPHLQQLSFGNQRAEAEAILQEFTGSVLRQATLQS